MSMVGERGTTICCVVDATVVVTRRESGAWKWALLQFAGLTALAYGITFVVYQVGRLLMP